MGDGSCAPFSYTIGLTAFDHPEVVITGMPFESAQAFLNLIGAEVRDGKAYRADTWVEELTDAGALLLIPVHDIAGLTAIEELYGRVDALQLVWCDSRGRFPWEADYRNRPGTQPLLGPLPDPMTN